MTPLMRPGLHSAWRMAAGYVAASVAAAAVIVLSLALVSSGPLTLDLALVQISLLMIAFVTCMVVAFALLPFLILVVYAKRNGVRAVRWYVGAGAATGLFGFILYLSLAFLRDGSQSSIVVDRVMVTGFAGIAAVATMAGMCAGFTYWLIAVRAAAPHALELS